MRAHEFNLQTGLSAADSGLSFMLLGGIFQVSATATWNGGSAELLQLGPDQATWLSTMSPLTADGGDTIYLPPARYRWLLSGGVTGASVAASRVPGE